MSVSCYPDNCEFNFPVTETNFPGHITRTKDDEETGYANKTKAAPAGWYGVAPHPYWPTHRIRFLQLKLFSVVSSSHSPLKQTLGRSHLMIFFRLFLCIIIHRLAVISCTKRIISASNFCFPLVSNLESSNIFI